MASWPKVSLLIATRCQESVIVERLRNASALNYPSDRLEIIVGCDGDGDLTALLARSFDDSRVKVVQLAERRGTAAVLNECVSRATGEILVFSDVNTRMRPDALRRMVRHFQQPEVGAVCGKLLPVDPTTGRSLSGLVWKFETTVSRCEARLGALSQLNGGIYAVRTSLDGPRTQSDPSVLSSVEKPTGTRRYRVVYDDTAIAVEETPPTIEAEFRARMKSGAETRRNLRRLSAYIGVRSTLLQVVCWLQRRLRQVGPAFLLAAFVSNACLSSDPFYLHLLLLHESVYLVGLIALFFATGNRWRGVLHFAAQLAIQGYRLLRAACDAIPLRRRRLSGVAQEQAAANQAAR